MQYYSTNNRNNKVSFRTAIMQGLAADKGLYMPELIPNLKIDIVNNLQTFSFQEIAFKISKNFIDDEINNNDLENIIKSYISI